MTMTNRVDLLPVLRNLVDRPFCGTAFDCLRSRAATHFPTSIVFGSGYASSGARLYRQAHLDPSVLEAVRHAHEREDN